MNQKILCIHPRRGLFQITQCAECGHTFECDNCDANLVTYRTWEKNMELVCHQCQSYYNYPVKCPECGSNKIKSAAPGIDELENQLKKALGAEEITRLDKKTSISKDTEVAVTTRIFDPSIEYGYFDTIIFINAQNLLASPDYLVHEDITKNLSQLLKATTSTQKVIFDTKVESDLFDELLALNENDNNLHTFYEKFLDKENKNRSIFQFPPYYNLVLITTQNRNRQKAWDNSTALVSGLKTQLQNHEGIVITPPYPARFLRRKGLYSYHVLLKYPKNYSKFFELRDTILSLSDPYLTQIRLNPKHLF